jgi:hypothetical protein
MALSNMKINGLFTLQELDNPEQLLDSIISRIKTKPNLNTPGEFDTSVIEQNRDNDWLIKALMFLSKNTPSLEITFFTDNETPSIDFVIESNKTVISLTTNANTAYISYLE